MPPTPSRQSPRRKPVQERAQATVRVILEGAAQVFERRGYAATTDQIAERAGVSIGSLYQYFPNKDAVLVALAEAHFVRSMTRLRPLLARLRSHEPKPQEAIRALVRASIENNSPRPRLHRMLHEQPAVRRALRRQAREVMTELTNALTDFLDARADIGVRTPRLSAALLAESIMGLIHEFAINPPEGFTTEDCEAELVALYCAYLSA